MFGEILGGLVGGLLGGDDQTATQQQKMDPRMDAYVYGKDGQGGLLGTAYGLMNKQLQTGGMNPLMQGGMEMQRQFLTSPQYSQGYNNLMGLGQSLLGGGIAGNPFTGGGRQTFSGFQQPTAFNYNPQGVPQQTINALTQPMQFESLLMPEPERAAEEPADVTSHHFLSPEGQTMYRKMIKQGVDPQQALFEAQRMTFVGG
jgi:hypothetical protein